MMHVKDGFCCPEQWERGGYHVPPTGTCGIVLDASPAMMRHLLDHLDSRPPLS
jgi:hypothetical protein